MRRLATALLAMGISAAAAQEPIAVYAAGSLRETLTEVVGLWQEQGQADVFLTYCTNAVASRREVQNLKIVELPSELQVGAAYGLTVRSGAPVAARQFALFVLSPPAQAVFARLGFGSP